MTEYEEFCNLGDANYERRLEGIQKFGFAIISNEVIEELKKYEPILEVGCGTGYWSYELKKSKVDVIATDDMIEENYYFNNNSRRWVNIEEIDAKSAVLKYPERNILYCWPCYGQAWSYKSLKVSKCKYIFYCGEGFGGCTADDAFHEELSVNFKLIKQIEIPQWDFIHDKFYIYERI